MELDWYIPSTYGDISLRRSENNTTLLTFTKLSNQEAAAIQDLKKHSLKFMRKWATKEDWERIPTRAFEPGDTKENEILLKVPVPKVVKFLTKNIHLDRDSVHVIKFDDGKIQEASIDAIKKVEMSPYRKESPEPPKKEPPKKKPKKAVAVTVQKPVQGCPAPDFPDCRIRANRVLRAFLSPQQISDFEKHEKFVTVGADTGDRYMITSRMARKQLRSVSERSVYNLTRRMALCVHDWTIPPEEEMLTMHLMLNLPGHENYICRIPDI